MRFFVLYFLVLFAIAIQSVEAKPHRRVLQINPIADRYIELWNKDEKRAFGESLYFSLITDLNETKDFFILTRGEGAKLLDSNPINLPTHPIPTVTVQILIDELSFTTGTRGTKLHAGFKRGHENPFHGANTQAYANEFPVDQNWFPQEFVEPELSEELHAGLELGHEINFDVLLLGANLKHEQYTATLGLKILLEYADQKNETQNITVKGKGFYWNLSAHYMGYSGAIELARKKAFDEAFKNLKKIVSKFIIQKTQNLPLLTQLGWIEGRDIFVNAGQDYRLTPGTIFYNLSQWKAGKTPSQFIIEKTYPNISKVKSIGDGFQVGDVLTTQKLETLQNHTASLLSTENSQISIVEEKNLSFPKELKKYKENFLTRLWKGLKALVTLPYRVWRFFQYDQEYKGGEIWEVDLPRAQMLSKKSWALEKLGVAQAWLKVGLGDRKVVVAIIDSGVDYNHSELRRNIFWDGIKNTPGWDFISWDPRPYDDYAHGTEIASLIAGGGNTLVGVAPRTTLLPIKVFSPYGVTTSAVIFSAFQYAIEHGAKIIVIGWSTSNPSQALKEGIGLAQSNGVLVIASSGDQGKDLETNPQYPAFYKKDFSNLMVVAGMNKEGKILETSNHGSLIDLIVPAEKLKVARPRNHYKELTHTGLAAGLVSGASALLWSTCFNASYDQIKNALLSSQAADNKELFIKKSVDKINQDCK